jgi:aldehyde:ferredoxin oxidoreductase
VINVREGLRPEDDTLPSRLIKEAVPDGPLAGKTVDFALMRSELYEASGLDPVTSLPTDITLARLGLEWVKEDPVVAGLMEGSAE